MYQVEVDCSNLGYHCTCPSRKFPCKHVLGLLMLYAESAAAVASQLPPEWVTAWLSKRQAAAEKKAARSESATAGKPAEDKPGSAEPPKEKPGDEKAQVRRAPQRESRVRAGLDHLDLWARDLVRNGLAGLETQSAAVWEEMAKRLVDASAGGLAARVRRLGELPGSSRDWPQRLLAELGRLKLVAHAYGRLDKLDPPLQSDLRQAIGWTIGQDELQGQAERVRDDWLIYGQWIDDEDRVQAQRLDGRSPERPHGAGPAIRPRARAVRRNDRGGNGPVRHAGLLPRRGGNSAKFLQRTGNLQPIAGRVPGSPAVEHYLATVAEAMARQPLLPAFGCVLHDVTLLPGDVWHVRDGEGRGLPLLGKPPWKLLAISGGHAIDLAGEWDGHRLRPLGMVCEGEYRVA